MKMTSEMRKNRPKRQNIFSVKRTLSIILVFFLFLKTDIAFCEFEEYELKAVYLERITRFLEWPDETQNTRADDLFVIGILGENPFGRKLEDLYAGRGIKNKPIKVYYLSELREIERVHLLFVSRSESEELSQILDITRKKPILTVGDTRGFAEKGGLVNFFIESDKLRFEINERGFHEAGLVIDPLLLKVAKIVNTPGDDR